MANPNWNEYSYSAQHTLWPPTLKPSPSTCWIFGSCRTNQQTFKSLKCQKGDAVQILTLTLSFWVVWKKKGHFALFCIPFSSNPMQVMQERIQQEAV
mmetsp:Transcript_77787/g.137144  ORF Transcript_77787/g.137144 Transcript_77787/m.137144 type:complete len:97 (-) Transcript_77787:2253-2543(-)